MKKGGENIETIEEKNYASAGVGNTALGLSIGALAVPFLNGTLGNVLGGNNNREPVATLRDIGYERQLTEKDMLIVQEKAENNQLKAQIYTNDQIQALERRMTDKFESLETRLNAMNQTQAVLNAKQEAFMGSLAARVASFDAMTARYINGPVMAASEAVFNAYKPQTATTTSAGA